MNEKPQAPPATPPAPESAFAAVDLDLARAAAARDPDAMDQLLARMRCVSRILATQNEQLGRPFDSAELDDVAQNVMLLVWRKLPEFEGRSSLERWIFRICHLEMLSQMRRKKRRPALDPERLAESSDETRAAPDVLAMERALRLLNELPEETARVIRMKHFDMLTFEAIAARLSLSPNTVKTTYYRALVRLRRRFDGGEGREAGGEEA